MEPEGSELFASWQAMVRVCDNVLGSRDDAEDCASDALVQAFTDGMHDVENVEAWLVAVAKRRALDEIRRRVRTRRQLIRLASRCETTDPDPSERVADESEARWLAQRADELLSPPARAVLRVVADGGSVNEAASTLAMTRRSAESHLHRARHTLRAARVALPTMLFGLVRAARRPAAVSSMALVAGIAVIAPAYLSPATPEQPRTAVLPVMGEVTNVTPDIGAAAGRAASRGFDAVHSAPRSDGGVTTSSARRREVTTIETSQGAAVSAGVRVATEHRSGPSETIGVIKDCIDNLTVSRELIGC